MLSYWRLKNVRENSTYVLAPTTAPKTYVSFELELNLMHDVECCMRLPEHNQEHTQLPATYQWIDEMSE